VVTPAPLAARSLKTMHGHDAAVADRRPDYRRAVSPDECDHEWGAAELSLDDSGASIEVCLLCGELRYVCGNDGEIPTAVLLTGVAHVYGRGRSLRRGRFSIP
jgi:hypothetical protein